jgi:hypothetical protein
MTKPDLRPVPERLADHYEVSASGCWSFTGYINPDGYGRLWVKGRYYPAHVLAYQEWVGPVPEGLTVDHVCHNGSGCAGGWTCLHRRCINPAHLEAVPQLENVRRGVSVIAEKMAQTHCVNGHELTEANLAPDPRGKRQCRSCKNARDREKYRRNPQEANQRRVRRKQVARSLVDGGDQATSDPNWADTS